MFILHIHLVDSSSSHHPFMTLVGRPKCQLPSPGQPIEGPWLRSPTPTPPPAAGAFPQIRVRAGAA